MNQVKKLPIVKDKKKLPPGVKIKIITTEEKRKLKKEAWLKLKLNKKEEKKSHKNMYQEHKQ